MKIEELLNTSDNLLIAADNFYQKSLLSYRFVIGSYFVKNAAGYINPAGVYVDPEDSESPESVNNSNEDVGKYNELLNVIKHIRDPGLSAELQLLSKLYLKSIEMNDGFNYINNFILNLFDTYFEDESPQTEEVEDVLNQIAADLRNRIKSKSNKTDSANSLNQIKSVKQSFDKESIAEEADDLTKFQENAASTFDPTGGASFEKGDAGFGSGYGRVNVYRHKDWKTSFENERLRYLDILPLAKSISAKQNLEKLINLLSSLKEGVVEEKKLDLEFQSNADPDIEVKLNQVKENNNKLKILRNALKTKARQYDLENKISKFNYELNNTKDDKIKERIKQEIELYNLLKSRSANKSDEISWRKLLIKSMSGGSWPSQETIDKLETKIQEASLKKRLSKDLRIEEANKVRDIKQSGKLKGLVIHLQQKLASFKKDSAKTIASEGKRDPRFSKLVNDLTVIESNFKSDPNDNNKRLLEESQINIAKVAKAYLDNHPKMIFITENIPTLYSYRDKVSQFEKLGWLEYEVMPDQASNIIQELIVEGQNLIDKFGQVFKTPCITISDIINQLKSRI